MIKKSSIILSISLEDIHCFLTVAELKSFTEAAVVLYTTQPQLSKRISAMESRIGIQLFDRSKRQIKLTPAGERLFSELEPQIRRIEDSFERIGQVFTEQSTTLRLSCDERMHGIDDFLFSPLLRFQQENPKIMVDLIAYNLPTLKNRLVQKETDLVLTSFPEPPLPCKGIQWVELEQVQMCVAVRSDHPFAYRRFINWSEMENESLLLRSSRLSYEYYNFILNESEKNGFSANTRIYPNEQSIILNLKFGNGICIGNKYDFDRGSKLISVVPIANYYDHIYAGIREDHDLSEWLLLQGLCGKYRSDLCQSAN